MRPPFDIRVLRRSVRDSVDGRMLRDPDATTRSIVSGALTLVPTAVAASLASYQGETVQSGHASDEAVARLDVLQSELGQGPCLDAESPEDGVVFLGQLDGPDAARWPDFAPRAVTLGFGSLVSTRLVTRAGGPRVTLNIYGRHGDAFGDRVRFAAATFAVHAAALLNGTEEVRTMRVAVDSRDVIGQAKGILMERFDVSDDGAFQMLVTSSQDTNIKLADVAQWLVGEALRNTEDHSRTDASPAP